MITRIARSGSNARRLVGYLTRKGPETQRLLATNLPDASPGGVDRVLRSLREVHRARQARYVKHMILSFPPGERPADGELREIVAFYLERMGYGEAPFAAYLHTDRPHAHVHVVTTPTSFTGEAVSEAFDARRSQAAAREIERRWNLQRVASPEQASLRPLGSEERRVVERTAEPSARTTFQLEIAEAGYHSRTLPELVVQLAGRGYRVQLSIDEQGAVRGASYEKDGVRFKGSQLGKAYQGNGLPSARSRRRPGQGCGGEKG